MIYPNKLNDYLYGAIQKATRVINKYHLIILLPQILSVEITFYSYGQQGQFYAQKFYWLHERLVDYLWQMQLIALFVLFLFFYNRPSDTFIIVFSLIKGELLIEYFQQQKGKKIIKQPSANNRCCLNLKYEVENIKSNEAIGSCMP